MVTRLLPLALIASSLILAGCEVGAPTSDAGPVPSDNSLARPVIPGHYIVVLDDAIAPSGVRSVAERLTALAGGTIGVIYSHALRGFSIETTARGAAIIARDARVRRVEQDIVVTARPTEGKLTGRNKAQDTSWGTTRVGGSHDGTGRRAWIIDSGIDLDHPDLRVDTEHAATFVAGTSSADDQNGHGTHVAGIVGALNNAIGSIGVAAGATVVPVRVLDRRGNGEASWVIAGIDYVLANAAAGDVANLSFGAGLTPTIDEAVLRLAGAGIRIAIAAGNDGANCAFVSPARVNHANVYTVSAIDASDRFASFSNYGAGIVDIAAPGVEILSSRRGGGVVSMTGTSMAAPHVAGLLLLGSLHTSGTAVGDVDGQPDPIAVY
ncbi:MAG TPA: S8 family serine peptidase [Candidatus Kapabacteria bacterium]|nr:S8 family serine peptidase [Candidatus Kapabacteria bacterium]